MPKTDHILAGFIFGASTCSHSKAKPSLGFCVLSFEALNVWACMGLQVKTVALFLGVTRLHFRLVALIYTVAAKSGR